MKFIWLAVLASLFIACRKECDTVINQPSFDMAASIWFADSLTDTLQMKRSSDQFNQNMTIAGKRENWLYPENEADCKELFMTISNHYAFVNGTDKLDYRVETNDINGSRIRIQINGTPLQMPLSSNSGSLNILQNDTGLVHIVYSQVDSVSLGSKVYKPVRLITATERYGRTTLVSITPHWGIISYTQDTITWEASQ